MRNEMQNSVENTRTPVTIEKLQDDIRRLEIKVAGLSNVNASKTINDVEVGEPPHTAIGKCQRCKNCKHMRYPHRSNPHYTCEVRHSTIEPTWTCGQYDNKKITV
jgi:ribosomal protein L32